MASQLLASLLCLTMGQVEVPLPAPSVVPGDLPLGRIDSPPAVLQPSAPGCSGHCGDLFWFNAEYLLWWTKNTPSGPLVTQGTGTPIPGTPGTTVLYGANSVAFDPSSGYRVDAGFMLGRGSPFFIEGSWAQLLTQTSNFSAASSAAGSPSIATLFFIPGAPGQHGEQLSAAGLFAGSIHDESTLALQTWDLNVGWDSGVSGRGCRFGLMAGFRSLELDEDMTISARRNDITGPPFGQLLFDGVPVTTGSPITSVDSFHTTNQFYGGQLGAKFSQEWGAFSVGLVGKFAMGNMHESVSINGSSTATQLAPGAGPMTVPGGIYALPSNIGSYSRNVFAIVPEGTLTFGWQITSFMKATVGYDFLWCSDVIRPGDTIDRTVNPNNVPTDSRYGTGSATPARPTFPVFSGNDFWAQGINVGLQFRY